MRREVTQAEAHVVSAEVARHCDSAPADRATKLTMKIAPCTHRPPCPGCPRYGERGLSGTATSVLAKLADRTGAVLDAVVEGPPLAFRVRARLAVRGRSRSPKLGIFQEGTHAIADIPSCTIQHPRINEAARVVRHAIRASGVSPYADRPHVGLLRYVQIVVERPTARVQVVLVTNDSSEKSILPMAALLAESLGARLQGLWWNGNPERTNAIFGPDWKLLTGEEAVRERIGGADVFFPAGAFGQSNLDLADRIVADVHARVPDDAVVAELYCGVGAIGLGLAARSREVRFNEVSPHGLRGLELGIEKLAGDVRPKVSVTPGDAASGASILAGADVAIVDPPRKGLDENVVAALCEQRPARVLYVSCDAESLARDAASLTRPGRYRLRRLTPYALFPYTDHVETLAELS
jgi:23S rRNA (uracil1939-C5)-methyltransferase